MKGLTWAALVLLAVCPLVHASVLPGGGSQMVAGDSAETVDFAVPGPGSLAVTLTDEPSTANGTDAFGLLEFYLGTSNTALSAITQSTLGNPGVITLDLTAATDLSAFLYWQTPTAGLLNLTADYVPSSPVDLPSGGLLLAAALPLLWLCARGLGALDTSRIHGTVISPVA